jgi:hypothetical protein
MIMGIKRTVTYVYLPFPIFSEAGYFLPRRFYAFLRLKDRVRRTLERALNFHSPYDATHPLQYTCYARTTSGQSSG